SAKRGAESETTFLRKLVRAMVWMLSKFTMQSVGTPSATLVSSSSDTSPRRVRVTATTTTAPIRLATGARVRTSTGRSPPGVAANQTSPRCIGPVRPVLRRPPVGDLGQCALAVIERLRLPPDGVVLACQPHEVTVQRIAQELGPIDPEPLGP